MAQGFETSDSTPSNELLPTRPYLLSLPTQLGNNFPNVQDYLGTSHSNPHTWDTGQWTVDVSKFGVPCQGLWLRG